MSNDQNNEETNKYKHINLFYNNNIQLRVNTSSIFTKPPVSIVVVSTSAHRHNTGQTFTYGALPPTTTIICWKRLYSNFLWFESTGLNVIQKIELFNDYLSCNSPPKPPRNMAISNLLEKILQKNALNWRYLLHQGLIEFIHHTLNTADKSWRGHISGDLHWILE